MSAKPTAGEWTVGRDALSDLRIETPTASLADVQIWSHGVKGDPDENLANARLFAAAKDLWYICKAFAERNEDSCGDHCSSACLPCAARAIVRKAEG